MRAGPARLCAAIAVALAFAGPALGQDVGKIASEILHRASPGDRGNLTLGDVSTGLKAALGRASELAASRLAARNGYMGDAAIRIALPGPLGEAHKRLGPFGMAGPLDELQVRVNRAAEASAPAAGRLLEDAVKAIAFDDAMMILRGGDMAATRYLRGKTEAGLRQSLRPQFSQALATTGALADLDAAVAKYGAGLVKTDTKTWLIEEATRGAIDGLFYYVAREEQAIRRDPQKRTSDILRKVFGG